METGEVANYKRRNEMLRFKISNLIIKSKKCTKLWNACATSWKSTVATYISQPIIDNKMVHCPSPERSPS